MKKIAAYKFTIASACLTLVALLLPSASFSGLPSFLGIDKIAHFGLFLVFTLSYLLEYRREKGKLPFSLQGTLIILVFIVCSEFSQLLTISRNFDWIDMLFDAGGAATAFIAVAAGTRRQKH